jgi:hypothetical protein
MKIEKGKYYRTRSWDRAFIHTIEAPGNRPISGVIKGPKIDTPRSWHSSGYYYDPAGGTQHPRDLMIEISLGGDSNETR